MAKKVKKRPKISVEDHGNGFMVIGTGRIKKARKVLDEYVDDIEEYRYWLPIQYEGRSSVWMATGPAEMWEGARDHTGTLIER